MADVQQKSADEIFCSSCGAIIKKAAEICPKCGVRQKEANIAMNKQRIAIAIASGFGMLATFLPWVSTPLLSINGANMQDGSGWISFVVFALPLIFVFLGDKAKPLAKAKYVLAALGLANAIFGISIIALIGERASNLLLGGAITVGFGLYLVIIAGIAVYLTSIFAKWFGNKESVITKLGILISLIPLIPSILYIISIVAMSMLFTSKLNPASINVQDEETKKQEEFLKAQKEVGVTLATPIEVTVNINGEEGRFVKCGVQLEYDPSYIKLGEVLEARKARIKDIVIEVLSSRSLSELITNEGKQTVRKQILTDVNNILPENDDKGKPLGKVSRCYFDSFMVQ